jgi:hypothetical protein
MRRLRSKYQRILTARVAVSGVLIAGALAGCGGGSSGGSPMTDTTGPNAPLAISQTNANATAAEAVITPTTFADTATTPAGMGAAPAAAVAPMLGTLDRRVVQGLLPTQNARPAAAGTVMVPCAVGGSFTAITSTDGKTLTATFADCSEVAGTSIGGTQTYTNLMVTSLVTSDSISANVTDALTITVGTVTFAETGDYALSFSGSKIVNGYSTETFELTGSSLAVSVSNSGALSDSVTLTNFDFNFEEDLTSFPHQLYSSFNYTLASSRLDGEITVTTTQEFKQIVDPTQTHLYPYEGQLLIAGAHSVRLQVTVQGDETFVPPAGQGQIELQLDPGTGTFGPATWLSWATLAAAG